jgi:RimJ/RimL family protein N-acetyltransferase
MMFARTERLLLRPGWAEDSQALATALSEIEVIRNLEAAPWPYSNGDAQRFLARPCIDPADITLLAFRRTSEGPQLIGAVGLGRTDDGQAVFASWIARRHWNCGYATEAGAAVLAMAWQALRLERVFAWNFADNPAGARMLEKLGFRATGEIVRSTTLGRGVAGVPNRLHVRSFPGAPVGRAETEAVLAA